MQCLSSDYALDKKLLQYTPNVTLTHIEDRVRTTHGEMEENRKAIDGSAHVLIAAGGPGNFPTPGHHQGDWDGPGKGGNGQEQQQGRGWGGDNKSKKWQSRTRAPTAAAATIVAATVVAAAAAAVAAVVAAVAAAAAAGMTAAAAVTRRDRRCVTRVSWDPRGTPPGTDRLYNASGSPPNLCRPQGVEPCIHLADPRPHCFR